MQCQGVVNFHYVSSQQPACAQPGKHVLQAHINQKINDKNLQWLAGN